MSKKNTLEAKRARRAAKQGKITADFPSYWVEIRHKVSKNTKLVSRTKAKRLVAEYRTDPIVGIVKIEANYEYVL